MDGGRTASREEKQAISNKVFVGNLSFDVTRDELIQAFSAAGQVVDAKVPTDRETGRPRGFAFVEFADDDAAMKSIQLLNGKDLKGRPLRVNEAENRPPRPAGAGGPPFRPSFGGGPGGGPRPYGGGAGGGNFRGAAAPRLEPPPDFDVPVDERGRPIGRSKGSRRNIRRRKRGFDY